MASPTLVVDSKGFDQKNEPKIKQELKGPLELRLTDPELDPKDQVVDLNKLGKRLEELVRAKSKILKAVKKLELKKLNGMGVGKHTLSVDTGSSKFKCLLILAGPPKSDPSKRHGATTETEDSGPDKALASGLKRAKTSKCYFLFIMKSPAGNLTVSAKPIPKSAVGEAKAKVGGGIPYMGEVHFESGVWIFECKKKPPPQLGALIEKTAKRDANLVIKAEARLEGEEDPDGEKEGVDKKLRKMLMDAKREKRHFALVASGSKGSLLMSKRKVKPGDIAAAKKELGGGRIFKGLCFGEDGKHVFETTKKNPPASLIKVFKKAAFEKANLVIRPIVREMSGDSTEHLEDWKVESQQIETQLKALAKAKPVPSNLRTLSKQFENAKKLAAAKNYQAANDILDDMEGLLEQAAKETFAQQEIKKAKSGTDSNVVKEYERYMKEFAPQVEEIKNLLEPPSETPKLLKFFEDAVKQGKAGNLQAANQVFRHVESALLDIRNKFRGLDQKLQNYVDRYQRELARLKKQNVTDLEPLQKMLAQAELLGKAKRYDASDKQFTQLDLEIRKLKAAKGVKEDRNQTRWEDLHDKVETDLKRLTQLGVPKLEAQAAEVKKAEALVQKNEYDKATQLLVPVDRELDRLSRAVRMKPDFDELFKRRQNDLEKLKQDKLPNQPKLNKLLTEAELFGENREYAKGVNVLRQLERSIQEEQKAAGVVGPSREGWKKIDKQVERSIQELEKLVGARRVQEFATRRKMINTQTAGMLNLYDKALQYLMELQKEVDEEINSFRQAQKAWENAEKEANDTLKKFESVGSEDAISDIRKQLNQAKVLYKRKRFQEAILLISNVKTGMDRSIKSLEKPEEACEEYIKDIESLFKELEDLVGLHDYQEWKNKFKAGEQSVQSSDFKTAISQLSQVYNRLKRDVGLIAPAQGRWEATASIRQSIEKDIEQFEKDLEKISEAKLRETRPTVESLKKQLERAQTFVENTDLSSFTKATTIIRALGEQVKNKRELLNADLKRATWKQTAEKLVEEWEKINKTNPSHAKKLRAYYESSKDNANRGQYDAAMKNLHDFELQLTVTKKRMGLEQGEWEKTREEAKEKIEKLKISSQEKELLKHETELDAILFDADKLAKDGNFAGALEQLEELDTALKPILDYRKQNPKKEKSSEESEDEPQGDTEQDNE